MHPPIIHPPTMHPPQVSVERSRCFRDERPLRERSATIGSARFLPELKYALLIARATEDELLATPPRDPLARLSLRRCVGADSRLVRYDNSHYEIEIDENVPNENRNAYFYVSRTIHGRT
ncbi:hypothetical protein EVAR_23978_1 [Eumeta japonica]|uniref:Uncharacterized protein n=1 Tax=Eumeta variegata TaxID=151549 RepID=A0A4C1V2K6_EUMVA|nr:hypothetical protein EVAR_23978_1 [Eumeta japonica]